MSQGENGIYMYALLFLTSPTLMSWKKLSFIDSIDMIVKHNVQYKYVMLEHQMMIIIT